MACLGVEPGAAGWKAQTNPLSYGGTPWPISSLANSTSVLNPTSYVLLETAAQRNINTQNMKILSYK